MHTTKYIVELKPNKFGTEKNFPQWLEDNGGILSVEPYYDPKTHRGMIRDMVLDAEEYLTMEDAINYARFELGLEDEEGAEFLLELALMMVDGPLMYDEKNKNILWVEPTNKKLRDLIKNSVKVK